MSEIIFAVYKQLLKLLVHCVDHFTHFLFPLQFIHVFHIFTMSLFTEEIKIAPECIVKLLVYKHAGIFKNTREVHREGRGAAECFSHFSSS